MDQLEIVPATVSHYDDYFRLRCEEKNLYWTGYEAAPDYHQFNEWYRRRINDANRKLYLLLKDGHCVGSLNIDYVDQEAGVGYSVMTSHEGQGLGSHLLAEAVKLVSDARRDRPEVQVIKAWIFIENQASARVAEKNGFERSDELVTRKRFGKPAKFYLYQRTL